MLGTDEDPGIMFRAIENIFSSMARNSEELMYKASMSYLEIYNENVRDLLNPSSGVLDLREDAKGVQVPGLREVEASSPAEVRMNEQYFWNASANWVIYVYYSLFHLIFVMFCLICDFLFVNRKLY